MPKNKLEPLGDGFVAFHTESGERWKHKDVADASAEGGYDRLFISDRGEERRYVFRAREPRDATIHDLRDQLAKAQLAAATTVAAR